MEFGAYGTEIKGQTLTAYFEKNDWEDACVAKMKGFCSSLVKIGELSEIPDLPLIKITHDDWAENWKLHIKPVKIKTAVNRYQPRNGVSGIVITALYDLAAMPGNPFDLFVANLDRTLLIKHFRKIVGVVHCDEIIITSGLMRGMRAGSKMNLQQLHVSSLKDYSTMSELVLLSPFTAKNDLRFDSAGYRNSRTSSK